MNGKFKGNLISINSAKYRNGTKKTETRKYENAIYDILPIMKLDKCKYYKIEYHFFLSNSGADTDNFVKLIQDVLQKRIKESEPQFDDNQFWKIEATKYLVKKGDEGFEFKISELKDGQPLHKNIENKKHKWSKK